MRFVVVDNGKELYGIIVSPTSVMMTSPQRKSKAPQIGEIARTSLGDLPTRFFADEGVRQQLLLQLFLFRVVMRHTRSARDQHVLNVSIFSTSSKRCCISEC